MTPDQEITRNNRTLDADMIRLERAIDTKLKADRAMRTFGVILVFVSFALGFFFRGVML